MNVRIGESVGPLKSHGYVPPSKLDGTGLHLILYLPNIILCQIVEKQKNRPKAVFLLLNIYYFLDEGFAVKALLASARERYYASL